MFTTNVASVAFTCNNAAILPITFHLPAGTARGEQLASLALYARMKRASSFDITLFVDRIFFFFVYHPTLLLCLDLLLILWLYDTVATDNIACLSLTETRTTPPPQHYQSHNVDTARAAAYASAYRVNTITLPRPSRCQAAICLAATHILAHHWTMICVGRSGRENSGFCG